MISDLTNGGKVGPLVDKMYKAGTRLYTPTTDMSDVPVIGRFMEVSDDESRWAVFARRMLQKDVGHGHGPSDEGVGVGEAAEEEEEGGGKRPHFVRLIDLLPPLPAKGDFEVSSIKASPYFFS